MGKVLPTVQHATFPFKFSSESFCIWLVFIFLKTMADACDGSNGLGVTE